MNEIMTTALILAENAPQNANATVTANNPNSFFFINFLLSNLHYMKQTVMSM